jgi:cytidylate kinase
MYRKAGLACFLCTLALIQVFHEQEATIGMKPLRVALDGPAGAGKSTVAKRVARELGLTYVDTGAMYRAITWKALQQKIDLADEVALTKIAHEVQIEFKQRENGQDVYVDGVDVTEAIRSLEVTRHVSAVSAIPGVREALVDLQRSIASRTGVVMDGRDIGTVVLPDSDVKIWLTASVEERATRRYDELIAKGHKVDFEQLKRDIERRDAYDSGREHSPMRKADDAVTVDTTGLTIDEVIARI